jgi:hypothetical protein
VSLAMLIESFGRDVAWLWSHQVVTPSRVYVPRLPIRIEADTMIRMQAAAERPQPTGVTVR